jgi:choline dehydrogenase
MLGGCSSTNAVLYVRGNEADYDSWANEYGAGEEWSFESVLPYFKRAERFIPIRTGDAKSEYHGADGPIGVTELSAEMCNPYSKYFVESMVAAGLPETQDFNSPGGQKGVQFSQVTVASGVRSDTASSYLMSMDKMQKDNLGNKVVNRKNLKVITFANVTKLIIENDICKGVKLRRGRTIDSARTNPEISIFCKREVILSAGAVNSPWIMMNSGLGPADHLREVGVPVVKDIPAVGKNLKDHLFVPMGYQSVDGRPVTDSLLDPRVLKGVGEWMIYKTGPLASGPIEAMAFHDSGFADNPNSPDMQIHFFATTQASGNPYLNLGPTTADKSVKFGVTFLPTILQPKSTGEILLKSNDPFDYPTIINNYLTDPHDVKVILTSMRLCLKAAQSGPFAQYLKPGMLRHPDVDPTLEMDTDEYLTEHMRTVACTVYHPTSTCRINDVVDNHGRVLGIQGLRIADCSICPNIPSGVRISPRL